MVSNTTEQESVVDIDSLSSAHYHLPGISLFVIAFLSLLLVLVALDADQKNVFTTVCS